MVIGLLMVQLFLCAAILYKEVVQLRFAHFASSIFFLVYVIVFVLEPLVLHLFYGGASSIVRGSQYLFHDPDVYYIFNCYGIALLLAHLLFGRRRSEAVTDAVEPPPDDAVRTAQAIRYVALLIIGGFVLFVYSTGMNVADLLSASRFAWFGESSFSLLWLTVSGYFLALSGIFAYYGKLNGRNNRLLAVACLAVIVLHGLITKDRKWVIFLASGWLAGHYETSGRKLTIGRRGALVLTVLFAIMVVSQFLRDVLLRYALGEQIELAEEIPRWSSRLIEFGDISYFYRASLEAIHQNLNNDVLMPLALPRRILFFFLPAGLSGGLKVEDISATFSDVVGAGDALRRGNMPPGLFGLFVLSFGWLASLVLIPLLALVLKGLDRMFRVGHGASRNAVLSLYIFAVVLAFRGDDSSAIYYVISTILFLLPLAWFGRRPPRPAAVETGEAT